MRLALNVMLEIDGFFQDLLSGNILEVISCCIANLKGLQLKKTLGSFLHHLLQQSINSEKVHVRTGSDDHKFHCKLSGVRPGVENPATMNSRRKFGELDPRIADSTSQVTIKVLSGTLEQRILQRSVGDL